MNVNLIVLCDLSYWKDVTNIGLTTILAIATVFLAIYTSKLVNETRLARKSQLQPYLSIRLEQAETNISLLFIIVHNIGQGLAYDLTFRIDQDLGDYGNEGMQIRQRGLFKEGMKIVPPGYLKKYFLIETGRNHDKKMQEELIVTADYKNIFNEAISEKFHIRLKEQIKASSISPPDTYIGSIDDSLKRIREILEK